MMARRSLWPREHGAYAQLGAPLATGLALRVPSLSAVLLAIASCAAFLAHEPFLVALGHRGKRLRESDGRRARIRLAILSAVATGTGAVGLGLATNRVLVVAAAVALPVAAMLAFAWRRAVHSLAGEVLAAVALPGAGAIVAAASGASLFDAFAFWGAWAIGYASSVVAVHRVIARHRKPPTWLDPLLASALICVTAACVGLASWHPFWVVALPLAAIAGYLVVRPPKATKLRAVGVALVISSVASMAIAFVVE